MIPKIIHLCWLSGDKFPASIETCLDSWKIILPDYEIWLWDTQRFDINSTLWTRQAYEAKMYAFAADYIRLYALYNYGGIYLDSDVVVYKSFNDLLKLPYFLGEDITHCFEAAVIGAEPHQKWIKDIMDRYNGLSFIDSDGNYNTRTLPVVFRDQLTPKYQFKKVATPISNIDYIDTVINVFPYEYFNSRDYIGVIKTSNSYCAHCYVGSWIKTEKRFTPIMKRIVPRFILNIIYSLVISIFYKNDIRNQQINYIHSY